MTRLPLRTIDDAPDAARELLVATEKWNGFLPNLLRILANAPTAIETYLTVSGINARTSLSVAERETVQITAAATHPVGVRRKGCKMPQEIARPARKPASPNFSSGPCRKRPGWSLEALDGAVLGRGRSHRSSEGKAKLREVIALTREVLAIPPDYRIGIVPGSDTGAVEMALWGLLGPRGVDVFAWESFGNDWVTDIMKELGLENRRVFQAGYGELPELDQAAPDRDLVFTWNGTSSGGPRSQRRLDCRRPDRPDDL